MDALPQEAEPDDEVQLIWEEWEPWQQLPLWLGQDDMGHFVCQSAQSSWEGRVGHIQHEVEHSAGNTWTPGYGGFEEQVKPSQWLHQVADTCSKCGALDAFNWACIDGLFHCERCWSARLRSRPTTRRSDDAIIIAAFGQLHILKANSVERHDAGGPKERFGSIDQYVIDPSGNQHDTEVAVVDAGVLEVAAQAGHRAVLMWGGAGDDTVSNASTFPMALDASWTSETEIVSPSHDVGGVYAPDIFVYRHSDGRAIKPFRIHMVYAAPSELTASALSAEEQLQQYLTCMEAKVRNVFRMCTFKERDEIVMEPWGCDGEIPSVYCAEGLAHMFNHTLRDFNFRRVTFAVKDRHTRHVFREVFPMVHQ